VHAEQVSDGRYRLLEPMPEIELWEFPPGRVVRVQPKPLSDGEVLVAVRDD